MRLKSSIIKQLIKEELQSFLQEYTPTKHVKFSNKPTSEETKAAIKGEETEEPEETPEDDKDPYGEDAPSLDPTKRKIQQCIKAGFTKAECKAKFGSEKAKQKTKDPGDRTKGMSFKDAKAACKDGDAGACARKDELIKRYRRRQKKKKGLAKKGAPETQGAPAKQPTRQQRMLAIKLLRALIQLQRHPQFQEILSAVKKAAAGGHPIARMALDAVNVPYGEQRK